MRNYQAQTPTWGQTKTTKTIAKKNENNNNDKGYKNSNNRLGGNLRAAS